MANEGAGECWQSHDVVRAIDIVHNAAGKRFQSLDFAIREGIGTRGKNLKDAEQFLLSYDRKDEDGTDAEVAADFSIHAGIGFGVIAALPLFTLHTRSGEPGVHIQLNSQVRRVGPSRGPADDLVTACQRDSRCGSASSQARAQQFRLERGQEPGQRTARPRHARIAR